jgi:hypothetical protein
MFIKNTVKKKSKKKSLRLRKRGGRLKKTKRFRLRKRSGSLKKTKSLRLRKRGGRLRKTKSLLSRNKYHILIGGETPHTCEQSSVADLHRTDDDNILYKSNNIIFLKKVLIPLIKYIFSLSPYTPTTSKTPPTTNVVVFGDGTCNLAQFNSNLRPDLMVTNTTFGNESVAVDWSSYLSISDITHTPTTVMFFKFRTLVVDFLLLVITDYFCFKHKKPYIIQKNCDGKCKGSSLPSTTKSHAAATDPTVDTAATKTPVTKLNWLVVGSVTKTSDYDITFGKPVSLDPPLPLLESETYFIDRRNFGTTTENPKPKDVTESNANISKCLKDLKSLWNYIYTNLFISGNIDDMNTLFEASEVSEKLSKIEYNFQVCDYSQDGKPHADFDKDIRRLNYYFSLSIKNATNKSIGELFDTNTYSHELFQARDDSSNWLPGIKDEEPFVLHKHFLNKIDDEFISIMSIKYEFRNAVVIMKQALDNWKKSGSDPVPIGLSENIKNDVIKLNPTIVGSEKRRLSTIAVLEAHMSELARQRPVPEENPADAGSALANEVSKDSSEKAIIQNYNIMTQILQLADETYIALSTIYVVVFGLQMQNESVIQFLSTTEGSPACYISALDNFGHLLQCIQKNKPINKFAKYIARITNGLHNYVLVNTLSPAASAIIDTFTIDTFTKNGQYDTIISVLKDGETGTLVDINSNNKPFNTNMNAVFELLNQAQTNTLDNNELISNIKNCFETANPTYYNMIFK